MNHIKEAQLMGGDRGIDYLIKMFENRRYDEIEGEDERLELLKKKLWEVHEAKKDAELVYSRLLQEVANAPLKIGKING